MYCWRFTLLQRTLNQNLGGLAKPSAPYSVAGELQVATHLEEMR
jgi:hypothetical protein